MKHRLASQVYSNGMAVGTGFKTRIKDVFQEYKPLNIIETGTYNGLGSTKTILDCLKGDDWKFISIECNSQYVKQAVHNLREYKKLPLILQGLTVSKEDLPKSVSYQDVPENIIVDHLDPNAYLSETNAIHDNILDYALSLFDYKPDFVLLDSAGHMGFIEFNYLMQRVKSSFILAVDDTLHFKHYQTAKAVLDNPKFTVLHQSDEKFGFGIYKYEL